MPPPATSRSYIQLIRENVLTTVNIILFSVGFALVLVGQYLDALVSVGVISFNLVISLIQGARAKYTLDRIALLTRPKATVVRDGREQQLDPGEIVVDDVLVLHAGDQIVVDGPITGGGRVEVDESLLTGESDLVAKNEGDWLYSGTFCITGQACCRAEHVGVQSVAGVLTAGARAYRANYTPLQRDINLIIRTLLLVAIFLEVLLVAASLVSTIPTIETVRMAMVIIGIVPNGLFLSISVAYALRAVPRVESRLCLPCTSVKRFPFHRHVSGVHWLSMTRHCEASMCWARQKCSNRSYMRMRTWEPSSRSR